jgi:hypothetical protein
MTPDDDDERPQRADVRSMLEEAMEDHQQRRTEREEAASRLFASILGRS